MRCELKMASIGIVGGKQLRIALCVAKVQGVPAVPIVDVEKLVADHYCWRVLACAVWRDSGGQWAARHSVVALCRGRVRDAI